MKVPNTSRKDSQAKQLRNRVMKDGRWFNPNAKHGTKNGYNYYGCQCEECTKAASDNRLKRLQQNRKQR